MVKRSNTELLSAVLSNTVTYDKFSAKLSVDLKPGQKNKGVSVPALLRIIKGKALMLSFQIPIPLLNAEVFRMVVTPDSILLIDRKDKMYVAEAIRDIREVADFAFEYQNLEALFTNQMFIAGKTKITPGDYNLLKVDQEQYVAHISSRDRQGVSYTFTSDYTDRVRKTELESNGKSTRMTWLYDNFVLLQTDRIFPVKMAMVLNLPSDEANMNLSYSKIELDGDFSIEFQIPAKYKRITLSQAIKIINSI
ncbi:hypothetical protein FACS1894155_02640 [Bacteroidia bacterium]|nr:hypothetical protein FACS1894155_02640 [Bacteroidia bacterium]